MVVTGFCVVATGGRVVGGRVVAVVVGGRLITAVGVMLFAMRHVCSLWLEDSESCDSGRSAGLQHGCQRDADCRVRRACWWADVDFGRVGHCNDAG